MDPERFTISVSRNRRGHRPERETDLNPANVSDSQRVSSSRLSPAVHCASGAVTSIDWSSPKRSLHSSRAAVERMGIPVSEILDEHEAFMTSVNGNAERFHEVFQRHFRELYVVKGMPAEEMSSVDDGRQPTHRLATSVVTAELHEQYRNLRRCSTSLGASESVATGGDS